jgi:hypothetical protein
VTSRCVRHGVMVFDPAAGCAQDALHTRTLVLKDQSERRKMFTHSVGHLKPFRLPRILYPHVLRGLNHVILLSLRPRRQRSSRHVS